MTDLTDYWPPAPVDDMAVERQPRHCLHPKWKRTNDGTGGYVCDANLGGCGRIVEAVTLRRGKQSRNYGNRAELSAARTYGGTKVGHTGGPVDIRGTDWNTQVKTHRRLPPREWTKAFAGMAASHERLPRLLLRFVMGPGVSPEDYFVVPAKTWLEWFGKDEETQP